MVAGLRAGEADLSAPATPAMHAGYGDYRDWDDVHAWAEQIAGVLPLEPPGLLRSGQWDSAQRSARLATAWSRSRRMSPDPARMSSQ